MRPGPCFALITCAYGFAFDGCYSSDVSGVNVTFSELGVLTLPFEFLKPGLTASNGGFFTRIVLDWSISY